uniref:Uncharacterized protein n=1 Tax=Arion vulgaris TaxID=1028688 RepID=A0A0B7AFS0_9EUPU
MRTANEFCNNLRKQLDTANKKMESSEKELKSLSEQSKRCEQQVMKIKEANTSLTNALQIERDTNMKLQKRIGGGTSKYEDLKAKFENMQKSYASEVNRLKALVDSSDRAIKNYKLQLDEMGIALLGDASHFKQITEDKHYDSLDDSLVSRDSGTLTRALRSSSRVSSDSISQKGSLNETTSSTDSVLLKREKLAIGTEPKDKGARKQTEDRLSVCSTSSSQSIKSMNGVPAGCLPNAMSCANEPEGPDFEWDRLSELQRRNTLYLPHLKSAYPVEMQIVGKEMFSDDTLRLSLVPNKRGKASPASYIRNKREETRAKQSITETESNLNKRKAPIKHIYEEISGESPPKQLRTGPVYQRPGPPTPGKQPRRISGRFTPSHGKSPVHSGKVKLLGSPSAKHNPRQTHTPRRSPRLSSLITPASSLREEEERRESIAYNIGFTPMKSSGPNRMMRQKGFVSTDKSTIVADSTTHYRPGKAGLQTGQNNRKPLSTRNFLETGL